MEKEIIDALASRLNIFKLIELSKKFKEIKLGDYFHLLPDSGYFNINYDYIDERQNHGFRSFSIEIISSFRLKNDDKEYTSKVEFLQNILEVRDITMNNTRFIVKDGEYNYGSDGFRSIEFSLHSTSGYSIIDLENDEDNHYCIERRLLSKEQYTDILRILKMNELTDCEYQTPKELVDNLENKLRQVELDKKKKEHEEKHIDYVNVTIMDGGYMYSAS